MSFKRLCLFFVVIFVSLFSSQGIADRYGLMTCVGSCYISCYGATAESIQAINRASRTRQLSGETGRSWLQFRLGSVTHTTGAWHDRQFLRLRLHGPPNDVMRFAMAINDRMTRACQQQLRQFMALSPLTSQFGGLFGRTSTQLQAQQIMRDAVRSCTGEVRPSASYSGTDCSFTRPRHWDY